MKYTFINGCNDDNTFQFNVVEKVNENVNNRPGTTVKRIDFKKLRNCVGCDSCQNVKPGTCAINDGLNESLAEYLSSDTAIIITPIQFGCCNSVIKNFFDRTQPLFLPFQVLKDGKTVMKKRYDRYPDLLFIGIMENETIESVETFKSFVTLCNLSTASKKVSIKIINENTDLDNLNIIEL